MEKKERLIEVGMFYYAKDRAFSKQLLSGKRVSGVVGYVDETGQHGLIVTLHQKVGEWANEHTYDADDYYVPQCAASKQRSCIVWYIFQQKTKNLHDVRCTDSSVICYNYSENGIRQGEAFLGNKEEMSLICQNRYQINQALSLIPGAELLHPSYYWTGSLNFLEKDEECLCKAYAWVLNFNNGMSYSCNIEYYAYILPLLEF